MRTPLRRRPRERCALVLALSTLLAPGAAAQAGDLVFDLEVLARRGDLAPGSLNGLAFEHFGDPPGLGGALGSPPRMDGDGNVAFHALLGDGDPATVDSGAGSSRGVWRSVGGTLEKIAELWESAPGVVPANTFTGFPLFFGHTPGLDEGRVTIVGSVGGLPDPIGLWSDRDGPLELLLLDDFTLDGMPADAEVFDFATRTVGSSVFVNARFNSTAAVDPADEGLWVDRGDGFEPVVIGGDAAPGTADGAQFLPGEGHVGPIGFWNANRADQVVFNAYLEGPGVDGSDDEGIWTGTTDGLVLVAREGEPAPVPGVPGAEFGSTTGFQTFVAATAALHARPVLNDRGSIVFGADFRDTHGGFGGYIGAFTTRSGSLELIAAGTENFLGGNPPDGDPAAGFPPQFAYVGFLIADINEQDEILLFGRASDGNFFNQPQGVWVDRGSGLDLVVGEGRPVPALPGLTATAVVPRGIGDDGSAWVEVTLAGPGVDATNDVALVIERRDSGQQVVLREGDPVDLTGDGSQVRPLTAFVTGPGIDRRGGRSLELFLDGGAHAVARATPRRSLVADGDILSVASGGQVGFVVDAGAANAGRVYLLLGGVTGVAPGLPLGGGLVLPLNPDPVGTLILKTLNGPTFQGFLGFLDGAGTAPATLSLGGPLPPDVVGVSFDFAALLAGPIDFVTNPVGVVFVP